MSATTDGARTDAPEAPSWPRRPRSSSTSAPAGPAGPTRSSPLFLPDLLDPDVVMTQPLLPPARGHDGFAAFFEVLFGAIPDLRHLAPRS